MTVCIRTKSKKIEDALLPMIISNWVIGCGGLIEYSLGSPHVIFVFSFIYSAIYAIAFGCLVYLSMFNEKKIVMGKFDHDYKNNSTSFFIALRYANILATFLIIIMSWSRQRVSLYNKFFSPFQRKKIISFTFNRILLLKGLQIFIKRVERVDEILRKLGISANYDKIYKRQLCLVTFVIIANVALITVNWRSATFMCLLCNWRIKIVFSIRHHYSVILQYFNDFYFIGITWYGLL